MGVHELRKIARPWRTAASNARQWNRAYLRPANTVSLGFAEGLKNVIYVLQDRAYWVRNEERLGLGAKKRDADQALQGENAD